MPIYIVSYDLNQPGQDYGSLIKAIESFKGYKPLLKSTWAVCHSGTAKDVFNFLSSYVDDTDRLFISVLTENACWRLDQEKMSWLEIHKLLCH